MNYQSGYAPLPEEATQNLRDEIFILNPQGVATDSACILLQDNSDAITTTANDVRCLCQAADSFYDHAWLLGLSLGKEGNTVEKFREWDAQQSARRTRLTNLVEQFLLRHPRGQPGPEDVLEATYIIGRGSTIKLLRFLDSHLYGAREHSSSRESGHALALVSEEIEGRIERRNEEEDE
jgi:hypothetical protein